jgi:hypothetical protein
MEERLAIYTAKTGGQKLVGHVNLTWVIWHEFSSKK